jgi:CubicO group peptidase (beta-lactamase class C family)
MRKILCVVISLGTTVICAAQTTVQQLESLLTAYAKDHRFNGSVLVAKKGDLLLNKGYGYKNLTEETANTPQTQFQIGSVTKQFTTAVIMKLQETGQLSVADHISKYFPNYPKGDSITIEQLMTHTSGIYSYTSDAKFMANEVTKPHTREQMMALFQNKPLDFSPGTDWNYSNSGFSMLGYIAEKASGKTYEKLVHELIFSPLQMNHSGFDFTHLSGQNKALGYFQYQGKTSARSPIVDSTVSYAAGAIYATTLDLYKWTQAVQAKKILSATSWTSSFTPRLNSYGYGWNIDTINGHRSINHSGGIHGFNANLAILPEDSIAIILLSNVNTKLLAELNDSILNILLNKSQTAPMQRLAIVVEEKTLLNYVGEYTLGPNFVITTSVDSSRIFVQATNQPKFEIFCEKPDYFFLRQVDAQIEFKRNQSGRVDQLVLFQAGRSSVAKKTK